MNGGHVHQEAPRESHVAGDARAFLAKRFLGDLNDHVLPGLQHFRNELRAARRPGMATMMSTVMPRAAGATAFESWTTRRASSTIRASATAVRPATAAIGPAAAIVADAVPSAAAERALETRTRIAANARGIPRKIFARGGNPAHSWCASFAG